MYRLGKMVFWIGILVTGISLVIGLFGRGWTALLIGIGCVVLGIITSQIPTIYLADQVKSMDESLTPKQAHDLVFRHLLERGDCADDTAVFLGRFGGEVEVVKKYRKAAAQGDAEAQYRLGLFYREGFGVAKDEIEAMKWCRMATEQGYVPPTSNPH